MSTTDTFGSVLKSFLDDTEYFNRKQWADFFSTTESYIELWVSDSCIPTQSRLSMLLDLMQIRGGLAAKSVLDRWNVICKRPIAEVVPVLNTRVILISDISTLEDYLKKRAFPPKREHREFLEFVCKKDIYTDLDLKI